MGPPRRRPRRLAPPRPLVRTVGAVLLGALLAGVGGAPALAAPTPTPAPTAKAGPRLSAQAIPGQGSAFDCSGATLYNVQRGNATTSPSPNATGTLNALTTSTIGSLSVTATPVTTIPAGAFTNGLGITRGGAEAYAVDQVTTATATTTLVHRYVAATSTWTTFAGAAPGNASFVGGAVDPNTNIYYYATYGSDGYAQFYGFDTRTQTALPGIVGRVKVPLTGAAGTAYNGDFAFDQGGNLYLVDSFGTTAASGVLRGGLPVVGAATYGGTFTSTQLNTYAVNGAQYNGIAFDNFGHLYLETAAAPNSFLLEVNPNTGAVIGGPTQQSLTTYVGVDLGACSLNPALTIQKDVESRFAAGDQFGLSVTGSGVTDGNTATTTGTDLGVQGQVAGPVIGVTGDTYTIAETAAETGNLANYTTTYACTDAATSPVRTVVAGTGQSFTLAFPAPATGATGPFVTCVFTNTALHPAISLTKTASRTTTSSTADVTTYAYAARNTGDTTLTGVRITDPQGGLSTLTCTPAQPAALAPGDALNCTASRTTTAGDLTAGTPITNTGTVSATTPAGATLTQRASATVTPVQTASLDLVKSASATSFQAPGETLTYTFAATNTGNAPLTAVRVVDPKTGLSGLACTPAQPAGLAPGDVLTCTATYRTTQADVDAGGTTNSATATGTPPSGPSVGDTDAVTVPAVSAPAVTLDKTATPAAVAAAGDVVTYSFDGQNTGNVTLSGVDVRDTDLPGLSPLTCTPALGSSLVPGARIHCTAAYAVRQADVDAGSILNRATLAGTPPTGAPVTASDDAVVNAAGAGGITLVKTASGTPAAAGDPVTYTFVATNTGNVTLTGVQIADPLPGLAPLSCTPAPGASLAAGAGLTCTAAYALTQADVDAGGVSNTATASGTDPQGGGVRDTDAARIDVPGAPALVLDKTADRSTVAAAGDVITYTLVASNTGNVTLTGVRVSDPHPGLGAFSCTPAQPAVLAPRATLGCTATYAVTQADLDAGGVVNTGTASGNPPAGPPVTGTDSSAVGVAAAPALSLVKTAAPTRVTAAGQVVGYTFVATNTGNVTLTGVQVTDPHPGLSPLSCTPGQPALLAPRATLRCTATYAATQADVDAGLLANTAQASGSPPSGPPVQATDQVTLRVPANPSVMIDKTVTPGVAAGAGAVVDFAFAVTNNGNVTLHGVQIVDALPGLSTGSCSQPQPFTLAPGQVVTCTTGFTYTLSQADADAGALSNTALVRGTDPNGTVVEDADGAAVTVAPAPSVALAKSALPTTVGAAGDVVTYRFVATNTGIVTLHGVAIRDPHPGLSTLACDGAVPAQLAPGGALTCTATYAATQADVDAGTIANTASVTATPPTGPVVTGTSAAAVAVPPAPALALTKTPSPTTAARAGDVITYTFVATNTGNVTLRGVAVSDPHPGLSALGCDATTPVVLAPGGALTCTATYPATQADLDAGTIVNTATVTGTPPTGPAVGATADAQVVAPTDPALTLAKTADVSVAHAVGDVITYTFLARNTGNVTVHDVMVTDAHRGLSPLTCDQTAPYALAPGDLLRCTATYAVTQADVNAGLVQNTASVVGTPPTGPPTEPVPSNEVIVPVPAAPAITLTKDADPTNIDPGAVGTVVTYTMTAKNTGNVSLSNVQISDTDLPGLSGLTCTPALGSTLDAGHGMTCTATYAATQADLDADTILNSATVTGAPPTGDPVSATDPAIVTVGAVPAVELVKTADPVGGAVGDVVTYRLVATNTGNVTLTDVRITDPLPGLSALSCDPNQPATLGPASALTCTATYTLTQADLNDGEVVNTATVVGRPPGDNPPVTDDDGHTVPLAQHPGLDLTKTADEERVEKGDTVTYTLVAANTGDVILDDVEITDPLDGLSDLDCDSDIPTTLNPGDVLTCTATYVATAADVRHGRIVNTATVVGTPPGGGPLTHHDTATVRTHRLHHHHHHHDGSSPHHDSLPNTGGVDPAWLRLAGFLLLSGAGLVLAGRGRWPRKK